MKSLSAVLSISIFFIVFFGCTPKESYEQPEINYGAGFFYFKDKAIADESAMRVFYYKPNKFSPDRPILFLIHGADRKVDHITEEAAELVEKHNLLLILPEYSEQLFPTVESYQYGNVRTKPKELWTYYVNDRIFKLVKRLTGSSQEKYYIWGNSAGSQFVHRQLIVGAYKFINKAFASNAGVYTMPTHGTDPFPFSLKGLNLTDEDLKRIFSLKFFILLGEDDIIQDSYFLMNDAAMRQGSNRLERGKEFYSIAEREAQRLNVDLTWKLITIPGCGHNPNDDMTLKVASLIFAHKN
jgi:hypothetical protein